jgi:hypothetical protein
MTNPIRQRVIVQPGSRIEIYVPELKPGTRAEVIILEEPVQPPKHTLRSLIGAGKGAFATPEEVDAFIHRERDSWK